MSFKHSLHDKAKLHKLSYNPMLRNRSVLIDYRKNKEVVYSIKATLILMEVQRLYIIHRFCLAP
jgi:hypothetical protein